jgi:hypothetical protein
MPQGERGNLEYMLVLYACCIAAISFSRLHAFANVCFNRPDWPILTGTDGTEVDKSLIDLLHIRCFYFFIAKASERAAPY